MADSSLDNDSLTTGEGGADHIMFNNQLVLQNILPYLPDRKDWFNLSITSKSIHDVYKEEVQKQHLIPPWPRDCTWPVDLSLPEDVLPPGMPRQLGNREAGSLDSFNPVWSRDGTQIASISNGSWLSRRRMIIHVVDQRRGHVKRWKGHGGKVVTCLDFGDSFLVSSGYDRHVKKWDCNNEYECIGDWSHLIPDDGNQFVDHLQATYFQLKVSPDSQTIVLLLKGSLCIFDSSDGTVRQSISFGNDIFGTCKPVFTPGGDAIIFGCGNSFGDEEDEEPRSDGFLKMYSFVDDNINTHELRMGEPRHDMVYGVEEVIDEFANDLAISRDGKTLVSCGTEVLLWRVMEGQRLEFSRKFELDDDAYKRDNSHGTHNHGNSVAFTPCEQFIAVAGGEKYVENYSFLQFFIIDGKSAAVYSFDCVVGSMRYSPKSICLYTANNKTTINPNITYEDETEDGEW